MACWTLWQRMPPRYQLTMRDVRTDDDVALQQHPDDVRRASRASSASPRSPRLRSSRGVRRVSSARARLSEGGDYDGVMLTTAVVRADSEDMLHASSEWSASGPPQAPMLPPRASAYISNMKNTMRINSAKRRIDEGTFSPSNNAATSHSNSQASTVSYSPKARATTAPAFPITKAANTQHYHTVTSPRHEQQVVDSNHSPPPPLQHSSQAQGKQKGFSGRRSPKRPSSGYSAPPNGGGRTMSVHTTTISPFGEVREFRAEGQSPRLHQRGSKASPSPTQQDCVIGDYQLAALYVDKGRVTFFRKTRPDVTQSVYSAMNPYVNRDDGSYLAHLRKAYLSGVRDLPKTAGQPKREGAEPEKHSTIKERMDYDRKVGRILDYYAKVDIPSRVHAPRPPDDGPLQSFQSTNQYPISSSTSSPQGFKPLLARKKAAAGNFTDGGYSSDGTESVSPRGGQGYGPQMGLSPRHNNYNEGGGTLPWQQSFSRSLRDPSGFVRINARAKLHDRFYLRTPGQGGQNPQDTDLPPRDENCECGMCRLEMEVALMAQLHRELGVSVDAIAAAQIRASIEQQQHILQHQHQQLLQQQHPEQHQQKQQSASCQQNGSLEAVVEEDCPARPNSASVGANLDSSLQERSTQTAQETTSLKVTLPNVEEAGDATPRTSDKAISTEPATARASHNRDTARTKNENTPKDSEDAPKLEEHVARQDQTEGISPEKDLEDLKNHVIENVEKAEKDGENTSNEKGENETKVVSGMDNGCNNKNVTKTDEKNEPMNTETADKEMGSSDKSDEVADVNGTQAESDKNEMNDAKENVAAASESVPNTEQPTDPPATSENPENTTKEDTSSTNDNNSSQAHETLHSKTVETDVPESNLDASGKNEHSSEDPDNKNESSEEDGKATSHSPTEKSFTETLPSDASSQNVQKPDQEATNEENKSPADNANKYMSSDDLNQSGHDDNDRNTEKDNTAQEEHKNIPVDNDLVEVQSMKDPSSKTDGSEISQEKSTAEIEDENKKKDDESIETKKATGDEDSGKREPLTESADPPEIVISSASDHEHCPSDDDAV